jgi:hypothetical protein
MIAGATNVMEEQWYYKKEYDGDVQYNTLGKKQKARGRQGDQRYEDVEWEWTCE